MPSSTVYFFLPSCGKLPFSCSVTRTRPLYSHFSSAPHFPSVSTFTLNISSCTANSETLSEKTKRSLLFSHFSILFPSNSYISILFKDHLLCGLPYPSRTQTSGMLERATRLAPLRNQFSQPPKIKGKAYVFHSCISH